MYDAEESLWSRYKTVVVTIAAAAAIGAGVAWFVASPSSSPAAEPAAVDLAADEPEPESQPRPAASYAAPPRLPSDDDTAASDPIANEMRSNSEGAGPRLGPAGSTTITDPEAAAIAYLTAAQTVTSADADRPHRRAEPFMDRMNPLAASGVFVWDTPVPGVARTIRIDSSSEYARLPSGDRISFQITYRRLDDGQPTGEPVTDYITVQRHDDGRWFTVLHSARLSPNP